MSVCKYSSYNALKYKGGIRYTRNVRKMSRIYSTNNSVKTTSCQRLQTAPALNYVPCRTIVDDDKLT